MGISTINAGMVKNAFLAGAKGLAAKKEWINELNVFPVTDGDTGTNMTLTIMAAAKEVAGLENPSMDQLAKAISSGSFFWLHNCLISSLGSAHHGICQCGNVDLINGFDFFCKSS